MTDRVPPVGPVTARDRRLMADRRAMERRAEAEGRKTSPSRDLVPVGPVQTHEAERPAGSAAQPDTADAQSQSAAAAFAAQMMGQGGQRNGIRGGPPIMDAARATYLGAEYSGEKERRPPTGKAKRTEV